MKRRLSAREIAEVAAAHPRWSYQMIGQHLAERHERRMPYTAGAISHTLRKARRRGGDNATNRAGNSAL